MGLQSVHDKELSVLGRIHTREEFEQSFSDARDAGFDNINIDLMYGIPNQTASSFIKSLNVASLLGPEHISVYGLKIEEGTPFHAMQDELLLPDEDTEYSMYMQCVEYLASRGYAQYEISNFARQGFRCRHNLKYWQCGEYLGLGVAAHSDFGGERFSALRDVGAYIDGMELVGQADTIWDERREILEDERMSEFVMLGMRLSDGVSAAEFEDRFGCGLDAYCGEKLKADIPDGFVTFDGDRYAFTAKGMYVSNYILSSALPFDYAEAKI
jgi:oxygen-independent coproporphyrinogen-3 oxidase